MLRLTSVNSSQILELGQLDQYNLIVLKLSTQNPQEMSCRNMTVINSGLLKIVLDLLPLCYVNVLNVYTLADTSLAWLVAVTKFFVFFRQKPFIGSGVLWLHCDHYVKRSWIFPGNLKWFACPGDQKPFYWPSNEGLMVKLLLRCPWRSLEHFCQHYMQLSVHCQILYVDTWGGGVVTISQTHPL